MKAHIVGVTAIEDPAYKRPWNGRNHHLQHTKPHLGSVRVERNIVLVSNTQIYVEETNSLALPLVRGRVTQK